MREIRSSGSVRGASGDGRPYRERILVITGCSGEGRLTTPKPDGAEVKISASPDSALKNGRLPAFD